VRQFDAPGRRVGRRGRDPRSPSGGTVAGRS
jgi:hypothetical protein